MTTRKHYTAAFKSQVVLQSLREDKTLAHLAAQHSVHPNQISQWRSTVLGGMSTLFERDENAQAAEKAAQEQQVAQLYEQIGRLTTQLAWIKKNLVSTLNRSEYLALLEREEREVSLSSQAQILSISRASLYYKPAPPSPEEVAIKRRIDEIYTAWPFYGSRRIHEHMEREGRLVNRKAVQRHMQEMGLVAVGPRPNTSRRNKEHCVYPYLLRDLRSGWPNHIWGIDITYIRLEDGWVYLAAVLDWCSRYVLAWELDQTLEMPFVLSALDWALVVAAPDICNSDQGSHFTSPPYLERLLAKEVRISMDGRGRALDNIFTERLWRSVKYEEVYLYEYDSPRTARKGLAGYFEFYNQERLHQSLEYRTPAEVYFDITLQKKDTVTP